MSNEFYENYLSEQRSQGKEINFDENYKASFGVINRNFGKFFNNKNLKVLELGSGIGNFSYFVHKKGIKRYVGVDLSTDSVAYTKKKFPKFDFYKEDIIKFLKNNEEKFDVIYMSHVFEHLTLDEAKDFLKYLNDSLTDKGMYINVMPNPEAYFGATSSRYADVTHKMMYNTSALSQLLRHCGYSKFYHFNSYIGKNWFEHTVHKIALKIFEFSIQLLGFSRAEVYTLNLNSVIFKHKSKKKETKTTKK